MISSLIEPALAGAAKSWMSSARGAIAEQISDLIGIPCPSWPPFARSCFASQWRTEFQYLHYPKLRRAT
jgi:hypothetical protein